MWGKKESEYVTGSTKGREDISNRQSDAGWGRKRRRKCGKKGVLP